MKTTRALAFAFTVAVLLAPFQKAGAQEVELKLKWPVGNRYVYRMEMHQNSEITPPGQANAMKQETEMSQEFGISVLKEREGGGRELEMEFLSQKMEMKMNGATMMTMDTKDPNAVANPLLGQLAKMIGAKFKYLTRADGTVEKVEGVQEFLAKMGADAPQPVQDMLKGMFNDENMNQISTFSNMLPAKPVKVGESWNKQVKIPLGQLGTFNVDSKITFTGTEQRGGNKCAVLDSAATMSSVAPAADGKSGLPMGMKMTFDSGKMSGKTFFDLTQGQVVETNAKQEFTLKMEMPNPQGEGKEAIKLTVPTVQNVTMKLVEVGKVK
jgi:uncharacterized protein DUF6263